MTEPYPIIEESPSTSRREPEPNTPVDYAGPEAVNATPHLPPRVLPDITPPVSRRNRVLALLAVLVIAAAWGWFITRYWYPAHAGVDQNGYLVGGKMMARTGSTGMMPHHPLGYVGGMWVRVPETGMNYPKYPIGLPLLFACVMWAFGQSQSSAGPMYAFLVSPVCATLALVGMYLLARQFAGVFASIMATLLLACSQVMLSLANSPNSHASCLAFVVWGVYLLLRFWQTSSIWQGTLGGFCIGFAVTIRYTEGLLVLLIAFVVLSMLRWRSFSAWRSDRNIATRSWLEPVLYFGTFRMIPWRDWRTNLRLLSPVIGWLIPVGYLVTFNLIAMGTPTGYDTTNESKYGAAFTLEHIYQNWEKLIRQVHDTGLFFVVPIGILGMAAAYRFSGRRATLLWLWLIPGTLTYMAYYWAPDRGVSYLRFFLTLFPPLLIGAAIIFQELLDRPVRSWAQKLVAPLACAAVVSMSASLGLYRGLLGLDDGQETGTGLEAQLRTSASLTQLGQVVTKHAPAGSVLFAPTSQLNYLQFVGDYECFTPEYFAAAFVTRLERVSDKREEAVDPDLDPVGHQWERQRFLLSVVKGHDDKSLIKMQNDLIDQRLAAGQRVFAVVVVPPPDPKRDERLARQGKRAVNNAFTQRFLPVAKYDVRRVATVVDVPRLTIDAAAEPPARPVAGRGRPAGPNRRELPQTWELIEVRPIAANGASQPG